MSVVGIDLGTTNSVVACMRDGRVHVLGDEHGNHLLPSVVSFHPNGDVLVGYAAKARRLVDAENTIASIKRLIGRPWDSEEIRLARQRFAFELREGPGQGALVVARGEAYTLPEISAFVLKRIRQIAEAAMGETVDQAVITVPAHFNELQRASTKVAGRVAGLDVLRILNEPTAAALAYGFGSGQSERVAVYDFGGGTFDCSLLDLTGTLFEVLATAGDTFLGGDDIDTTIAEAMCNTFLAQHRYDPRTDPQAFEKLRSAAEQIKKDLSVNMQAQVDLPDVAYGVGGKRLGLHFGMTQADLDALAAPYVERTLQVTQDALNVARLSPSSFDQIVLVGGSTRMPLVKRRVEAYFGIPVMDRVNPDEVVAIGAAVQAAALVDGTRKRSIPAPPKPGVIGPPMRAPAAEPIDAVHDDVPTEILTAVSERGIKSPPALPAPPPLPVPPVKPTRPSAKPALPTKQTLRPAISPPLPPPPRAPIPTPFGEFFPPKGEKDDGDRSITKMTELLPDGVQQDDHSFATGNTMPAHDKAVAAQQGARAADLSLTRGSGISNTLPAPDTHDPHADSPSIVEPPSITSPPHTQPLPTLPKGMSFPDPSRQVQSPKIDVPPTPWPGWKAVAAPLATEDISRIMPDALNRSLAVKSPVGPGPLATDDISRIMPDALNRSLSVKSPIGPGPLATDDISRIMPDALNRSLSTRSPVTRPGPAGAPFGPPQGPPHGVGGTLPGNQTRTSPQAGPASALPGFESNRVPPISEPISIQAMPGQVAGAAQAGGVWPPPTAPVLVDVTPRALVVETVGGFCDTVIPRNAKIPCEHTRVFATGRDMQTVVQVRVAQGEAEHFKDNTCLGELELSGLRPAPRGDVTMSVTFELDADGSLQVRAIDTVSGREARAAMKLVAVAQTEEEIEEMIERSRSVSVTG
jgi:molecular chaperone DnaK